MDDINIIITITIIVIAVTVILRMWFKEKREERAEKRRQTSKATAARHPIPGAEVAEVGAWLPKLLEDFGIDPEVLLEDEMPEDLKGLLPLAKGFINSGGLAKLLPQKTSEASEAQAGVDEMQEI